MSQGSRLKPDAPEFVPGSASKIAFKALAKEAAKMQKKQEKEVKKAAVLAKKADRIEKKAKVDSGI